MSVGKIGKKWIIIGIIAICIIASMAYVFWPRPAPPAEPLRIGVMLPFTGPYAAEARACYQGILLAVEEINRKGGVLGHPIELLVRDDELKPEVGLRYARELVEVYKVKILMGHIHAGMALATGQYAKEAGVMFFAVSAPHLPFFKPGNVGDYVFSYFQNPWMMATYSAEFAITKLGAKRIYLMVADYAYGWVLREGWKEMAKKYNVEIVGIDHAPLGTTDFSVYLTKIMAAKPDIIASLNFGTDFIHFVKQARMFGIKVPIVTCSITTSMAQGVGAEYMRDVYGTPNFYYELGKYIPSAKEANDKFLERYGYAMDAWAEPGYSVLHIIAEAIERTGVWPPDLKKIRDVILTTEFVTAKGKVKYLPETRIPLVTIMMVRGKDPAKITAPWDVFELIDWKPGDQTLPYQPTLDIILRFG
jgi:branched-chain amino acid transport system substrate-binding protein